MLKLLLGLIAGVIAGVLLVLNANSLGLPINPARALVAESTMGGASDDKQILYWVAPMDPNYRRDGPGKSPMGMDLIPVYEGEEPGQGSQPGIAISPAVINNIGVRTATAEQATLSRRVEAVGYIGYDEDRVSHVHLRVDGWIEELNIKYIGQRVSLGERLFRLYSRTLQSAQAEYLLAMESNRPPLIESARNNLRALGVSAPQIAALAEGRRSLELIDVTARQSGIVTDLKVGEGMYVQPATTVATIADLTSVWVLVEVFENQVAWIQPGQRAEMRLSYRPEQRWEGVVDYLYPTIDPQTRTLKVRLRFANPDEVLKPNMFAEVTLFGAPRQTLAIPREAVIRTGREERVVLAHGDGRFEPVAVETGLESGDLIEVRQGLAAGQEVVISGQFLIDSESSLKASLQRMTPLQTAAPPAPQLATLADIHRVDDGMLNVTHPPIKALGWPTMTMDFALHPGVDVGSLQRGDRAVLALAPGADGMQAVVAAGVIEATTLATINSVDPQNQRFNADHPPIKALGWPAMTMDFELFEGVELGTLAPGDQVELSLTRNAQGMYVVGGISQVAESQ